MPDTKSASPRLLARVLGTVERVGNALPEPATLFAMLAVFTLLASAVAQAVGLAVQHPASGETISAVSLLNLAGFQKIVQETVHVFVSFHPLGVVIVCLLGIAVAEKAGLIGAAVRALVLSTPRSWLTPIVVFAGVMSNVGADVGYVLLLPLAATIFHAVGRHPLAGLAAGFAGVSGGFSANLLISAIDVILGGLSTEAARLIDPTYTVTGLANYYFIFISTFLVTGIGTWVTHRVVEPRLGSYDGGIKPEAMVPLSAAEKRGLWFTGVFAVIATAVMVVGIVPEGGFLRNPAYPDLKMRALPFSYLVPFLFVLGFGSGMAYGLGAKTIKSDRDVVGAMNDAMGTLGAYLVLAFFAAQFIAYFNWTNLGFIFAVKGANGLRALGLDEWPIPMMIGLVFLAATINMIVGSASAKWALIAPIFVPMFMLLGFSPELVQAAYRVGDSVTNIITPLMAYFPLIITFARKYDRDTGMGTIIATMLPYSVAFAIAWTILLIAWMLTGLPVGPSSPLYLAS
ncbi:AbgT family transporter [Synoicihabitans lomoniglobus]|uniref:AbgT family transporter n=1 Tax=Synoicihabitans lomoniglobus TaxID=2909285 RepID=A0AAF0CH46_9BACT|nr:AbgT family transporter [Opitutaceae bacterium LMO-M01]WED63872.1 AbgT family transporter [Opitutaceae bacterium LMO-M01]